MTSPDNPHRRADREARNVSFKGVSERVVHTERYHERRQDPPWIQKALSRMPSKASSEFPEPGLSATWVRLLQAITVYVFRASSTLRTLSIYAVEVADFINWQQGVFGYQPTVFARREKLWERLAQRLDPGRPLVVLEFGVAYGYATNWWLRRLGRRDVVWHGFDRFTGLPRAWRRYEQGTCDAGGNPPAIDDERVRWHVGDVEDTLGTVDLAAARDAQWLVLFDLDIYEPTAFAWELIGAHLRPGDVLYFDEAGSEDERRVLDEAILPSIGCEPVGATSVALGLVVTRSSAESGSARSDLDKES